MISKTDYYDEISVDGDLCLEKDNSEIIKKIILLFNQIFI